jgi:hypothetical protein
MHSTVHDIAFLAWVFVFIMSLCLGGSNWFTKMQGDGFT